MDGPLFLYVTAPDRETADAIAKALIEDGACACVNIIPGMISVYRWEGRIERAEECVLIVKTAEKSAGRCRDLITSLHPYDVPAIAAIRIEEALSSPAFCAWVKASVRELGR